MLQKKYGLWMPWMLLVVLPLLFIPDAVDPYGTIRWTVLGGLSLLTWAWAPKGAGSLWARSRMHWGKLIAETDRRVMWAILLFNFMGIASLAGSLHPLVALWDVLRWLMLTGLMIGMAAVLREDPGIRPKVWRAGTLAGLILGGIWLLQQAKVIGEIPEGGDSSAATLGNPNFFSGAMMLLACCGIGAGLTEKTKWRWLGLGSAALCMALGWLGKSTGANLAMLGGIMVLSEGWIVWRWPNSKYAQAKWLRVSMTLAAAGIVVAGFVWILSGAPAEIQVGADSQLERVLLWRKSLTMIAESPLLGIGPGHWHYHILRLGTVSNYQGFATRYFMDAHNDYLQLTAERGILGGLAFLGMLAMLYRLSWKSSTNLDALASRMVLTVWMGFALTNMPGEQPYLTVFLILSGAMLLAGAPMEPVTQSAKKPHPGWHLFAKTALGIVFLLAAIASLIHQGLAMGADRANFRILMAKGSQNWPKTQKLAQAAASWHNVDDHVSGTPLVWFEGISYLNLGQTKEAIQCLQAAKKQHPWHPQVSSNLGAAYFMNGQPDLATAELEELITRFPAFDEARLNLSEIYLITGNGAKAARLIDYWRLHPGNPQFDGYYTKVKTLLGAEAQPVP